MSSSAKVSEKLHSILKIFTNILGKKKEEFHDLMRS